MKNRALFFCLVILLFRLTPSMSQSFIGIDEDYCLADSPYSGAIINYVWRYHSYPQSSRDLIKHTIKSYHFWNSRKEIYDKKHARQWIRRLRNHSNKLYVSNDTCYFYIKKEGYTVMVIGNLDEWQHNAREMFEGRRPGYFDKKNHYIFDMEVVGDKSHLVPGADDIMKKYDNKFQIYVMWLSSTVLMEYNIHVVYDREHGLSIIHDPSSNHVFTKDNYQGEIVQYSLEDAIVLATDYLNEIANHFRTFILLNPRVTQIDCFIPLKF